MQLKKKTLIIILSLITVLIAGLVIFRHQGREERERRVMIPEVKTITLQKSNLSGRVILLGQTAAKAETEITAKYAGLVSRIKADYGDRVTKGQVLLVQDMKDIDVSLAQAGNDRDQLAADLTKADATFQVEYANALADFKYIANDYARYQKLYREGAISGNEFDAQEQKYINAKNNLAAVKKQINHNGAPAAVLSKKAELNKSVNTIAALQLQKNDMIIKAPVSGVINSKTVDEGEYLTAGQKIFSIVDLSEMYVEYQASEMDIAHLKTGSDVEVQIASLGKIYPGKIVFIGQSSQADKKTFLVRVKLLNYDSNLRAGVLAKTELQSVLAANTLILPKEAVIEKNGKTYVFVLEGNKVSQRLVQLGLSNDDSYEVKSGLKHGEKVVIDNLSRLEDGTVVTAEENKKRSGKGS